MASFLSLGIGFHPVQLPNPEKVVAPTSGFLRDDFWAAGRL
jgi:hypothetical protein